MKAIRLQGYGAPDSLRVEEAPVPEIAANQVLVKVHAAGVNHIDYLKASGALKQFYPLQFPWIPGRDFAGTVEAVGEEVTEYKPGDAVYGDCEEGGVYAEYAVVIPGSMAKKPENLSFVEAASVPVAALAAWQGLFKHAQLGPGQTLLIHGGAGAVGGYAVQLAHLAGAKVVVTASGADRPFLESLGADHVIDYATQRFEAVVDRVDVVFDLVGGEVQQRSYPVLKKEGYLIATNQPPSPEAARKYGVTALMMHSKPSAATLEHIGELFKRGALKTDVAGIYALPEAAQAWQQLAGNLGGATRTHPVAIQVGENKRHGKIVLQVK